MIKKLTAAFFIAAALLGAAPVSAETGHVSSDGYFNGIRLAGRVKVVHSFPDIKVRIVHSFPDLRVKPVSSFPDDIGEWQFVDYGEDFTVEFVDSFEDIDVQLVNSFPGV